MIRARFRAQMRSKVSALPGRGSAARTHRFQPQLEQLEARLTPDTHTWTGTNSGLWSDPGNWDGGPPFGDPLADLVFPNTAVRYESVDDVPGVVNIQNVTFSEYGNHVSQIAGGYLAFWPGTIAVNSDTTLSMEIQLRNNPPLIGHWFTVGSGAQLTLGDGISGALAALIKDGPGTLMLDGVGINTAGPTNIDDGLIFASHGAFSQLTLTIASQGSLTAVNSAIETGSLEGAGRVYIDSESSLVTGYYDTSTVFSGGINGGGSLTKVGKGTLTLAGDNSYFGDTSVQSGTLSFARDHAASSGSDVTVEAGATLDVNGHQEVIGSLAGSGTVALGTGGELLTGGTNRSTTFNGTMSGSGDLVKIGTGTMTLAGQDSHSGATLIIQGILRLGAANATSPSSGMYLAPGSTFDLNNFNTSIVSLGGNGNVTLGTGTLTLTFLFITFDSFAGIISGTGGLVVDGPNGQTLSGNNTYTGPTTISRGTLFVNGSQPGSNVSIGPAGTLKGGGTVGMISAQGTVSPGNRNATGILHGGTTVFNSRSQFLVNLSDSGTDQLNINGSINLGGFPKLSVGFISPLRMVNGFVMAATGGIIGTFAGLQDGQLIPVGPYIFQIRYGRNSVVLTQVRGGGAPRSGDRSFTFRFLPPVSAEPAKVNQTREASGTESSSAPLTDWPANELRSLMKERGNPFSSATLHRNDRDGIARAADLFFRDAFARSGEGLVQDFGLIGLG